MAHWTENVTVDLRDYSERYLEEAVNPVTSPMRLQQILKTTHSFVVRRAIALNPNIDAETVSILVFTELASFLLDNPALPIWAIGNFNGLGMLNLCRLVTTANLYRHTSYRALLSIFQNKYPDIKIG